MCLYSTCWRWSCWGLRFLFFVMFIFISVVFAGVAWLSYKPVELKETLPYLQQFLRPAGIQISVDTLTLEFEHRFVIKVENLKVVTLGNRVISKINEGSIAFANRGIMVGNLTPKHVNISGLVAHLSLQDKNLKVGPLPISIGSEGQPDLVSTLNNIKKYVPVFRHLRTMRINEAHFLVNDKDVGVEWLFQDAAASFTHYKDEGERLTIVGQLRQKQVAEIMPLIATAEHGVKKDFVDLSLQFSQSNTDFIKPYIPLKLREALSSGGQVALTSRIVSGNKLEEPSFVLRLGHTTLFPETAYTNPVILKSAIIKGRYDPVPVDILHLQEVIIEGTEGNLYNISGTVADFEGEMEFNLGLSAKEASLDEIISYLPDSKMPLTTGWLSRNTRNVKVSNLNVTYNGKPSDMPECRKFCGLKVKADIDKGDIRFLNRTDFSKVHGGSFLIEQDYVHIESSDVKWSQQVGDNISVTIVGLFTPGPNYLDVSGDIRGEVSSLLDSLSTGLELSELPKATGQHRGKFRYYAPIHKGKMPIEEMKIDVETTVTSARILMEKAPGEILQAAEATVIIKDTDLDISLQGFLDDIPVSAKWHTDLEKDENASRVHLKLALPDSYILAQVPSGTLDVKGRIFLEGDVIIVNDDDHTFSFDVDMRDVFIKVPELNWQKDLGVELDGAIQGKVEFTDLRSVVDIDFITLMGKDVEIMGSLYDQPDKTVSFQFSPFNLGQQSFNVGFIDDSLSIIGKRLDISAINIFLEKNKSASPKNMNISLDVGILQLAGGVLEQVTGKLNLQNNVTRSGKLHGSMGTKVFDVKIEPLPGARKIQISTTNAGRFLSSLGFYDELRNGKMMADITLRNDGDGEGFVIMQGARAMNVPILAQLLALLSLEPLLDSKEGVRFDSITLPLRFENDIVYVDKAELDGPTLDLRFTGHYNILSNEVNLDGRLIPAVVLNRTLSEIPLLGQLLAGSQEGIVVADFKIKGLSSNPKVSVKPLSVVTPGLLKDIFGGIFK